MRSPGLLREPSQGSHIRRIAAARTAMPATPLDDPLNLLRRFLRRPGFSVPSSLLQELRWARNPPYLNRPFMSRRCRCRRIGNAAIGKGFLSCCICSSACPPRRPAPRAPRPNIAALPVRPPQPRQHRKLIGLRRKKIDYRHVDVGRRSPPTWPVDCKVLRQNQDSFCS